MLITMQRLIPDYKVNSNQGIKEQTDQMTILQTFHPFCTKQSIGQKRSGQASVYLLQDARNSQQ